MEITPDPAKTRTFTGEPAYIRSSLGLGDSVEANAQLLPPPGLCLNPQSSARKAAEDQTCTTSSGAEEEDDDEILESSRECIEGDIAEIPHHLEQHQAQAHLAAASAFMGMPGAGWNGWPQYPSDAHSLSLYNSFGPWSYPYGWPSMYMGNGVPPLAPDLTGMAGPGCASFEGWPAEVDAPPPAAPGLPPPPPHSPPLVSPLLTSHPIDADVPAPPPGIAEVSALDGLPSRPPPPEPPPGIPVVPAALEAPPLPPPPAAPPPLPPGSTTPAGAAIAFQGLEDQAGAIHNPFALDGGAPLFEPMVSPTLARAVSTPQPRVYSDDLGRAFSAPEESSVTSSLMPPTLSRAKSSPAGPLPPQPPTITQFMSKDGRSFRTQWTVDARKLKVKDKVAVSPSFDLGKKVLGTFKMLLYPTAVSERKGGASFKKAKGKGSVQLKCESPVGEVYNGIVTLTLLVCSSQDDASQQEENARGPLKHNFADNGICKLPQEHEEWDFGKATDEDTQNFIVLLDILDPIFDGVA